MWAVGAKTLVVSASEARTKFPVVVVPRAVPPSILLHSSTDRSAGHRVQPADGSATGLGRSGRHAEFVEEFSLLAIRSRRCGSRLEPRTPALCEGNPSSWRYGNLPQPFWTRPPTRTARGRRVMLHCGENGLLVHAMGEIVAPPAVGCATGLRHSAASDPGQASGGGDKRPHAVDYGIVGAPAQPGASRPIYAGTAQSFMTLRR